jgi:hypothetical protein
LLLGVLDSARECANHPFTVWAAGQTPDFSRLTTRAFVLRPLHLKIPVSPLPRLLVLVALSDAVAAADAITFNEHIRPILAENCFACHGSDAAHRKADLRLDQGADATARRDGIRAFAPGNLADSEAWQRILSTDPDEVMPPPESHKSPLKPEQRELLQRWIEQGAVYQNHWA